MMSVSFILLIVGAICGISLLGILVAAVIVVIVAARDRNP
jgi:hypothetical protein